MLHFNNLISVMEARDHSKNGARPKSHTSRDHARQRFFLLFIVFCTSISSLFAQDVITLKNGKDIEAIVQEIGDVDVKYKKVENPNGPNYSLKKADIFMIRYANGSKDVFVEDTTPQREERRQPTANNQQINPYNGNVSVQQPYPPLKYTFGRQISPYGSKKSGFLSGLLSFVIPGVGQFYNGDVGAGFLYMGSNIVCNALWMSTIKTDYYGNTYIDEKDKSQFTLGLICGIAVNLSAVVNAAVISNKVNIARGYRLADNTYLQFQPTVIPHNNLLTGKEYAYGMNFRLNF